MNRLKVYYFEHFFYPRTISKVCSEVTLLSYFDTFLFEPNRLHIANRWCFRKLIVRAGLHLRSTRLKRLCSALYSERFTLCLPWVTGWRNSNDLYRRRRLRSIVVDNSLNYHKMSRKRPLSISLNLRNMQWSSYSLGISLLDKWSFFTEFCLNLRPHNLCLWSFWRYSSARKMQLFKRQQWPVIPRAHLIRKYGPQTHAFFSHCDVYSSLPNKRTCTPYLILTKLPPCTLLFGAVRLFIFGIWNFLSNIQS